MSDRIEYQAGIGSYAARTYPSTSDQPEMWVPADPTDIDVLWLQRSADSADDIPVRKPSRREALEALGFVEQRHDLGQTLFQIGKSPFFDATLWVDDEWLAGGDDE